ncbi:aldehyde dehydrogenase family protein [Bradyrhizobium sp. WSM2254]|uniref:aldehyde dehydrogenase family protein n=1 Tax=Bradyrhizobium sp. WSM2254 TaxID=1188263 RepID=UPI0003F9AE70|nr:aldehyde dehydrogenase family protein [Bradyrhizobium sp. WSM2254]
MNQHIPLSPLCDAARQFLSRGRYVHTGVMWVNCYGLNDPLVGFGGTKQSGYAAKGGRVHLDTYPNSKNVYINA